MIRRVGAIFPVQRMDDSIEVLLVRRAITDVHPITGKHTYKNLPGEWIPVGSEAREHESPRRAAVRALHEKIGLIERQQHLVQPCFTGYFHSRNGQLHKHEINYFLTPVQDNLTVLRPSIGVTQVAWKTPQDWLKYIRSDEFTELQLETFAAVSEQTGLPRIYARQLPTDAIKALKKLSYTKR